MSHFDAFVITDDPECPAVPLWKVTVAVTWQRLADVDALLERATTVCRPEAKPRECPATASTELPPDWRRQRTTRARVRRGSLSNAEQTRPITPHHTPGSRL
jgi:hypothetical protein